MFKAKKIKCCVCGNKFTPLKKDVYRCVEKILMVPDKMIDVIDCPQCGCQNRLAERLIRIPNGQKPSGRVETSVKN